MKTKLLLLLLFGTFLCNAQININEGFESGNIPEGWSNNGFSVTSTSSCSEIYSCTRSLEGLGYTAGLATPVYTSSGGSFTVSCDYKKSGIGGAVFYLKYYNFATSGWEDIAVSETSSVCQTLSGTISAGTVPAGANISFKAYVYGFTNNASVFYIDNFTVTEDGGTPTPPVITYISKSTTSTSADITYSLSGDSNLTTSIIRYGLSDSDLTSEVAGFSTNSLVTDNVFIDELTPGTTYYYQVEATNDAGVTTGSVDSFTTLSEEVIAEYNFDNTYNNVNGGMPFTENSGTSFVTDRHGNANSAININDTGTIASITDLPYGAAQRTISLWVKINQMRQDYNMVFSYGQSSVNNSNGGSLNSFTIGYLGYNNNLIVSATNDTDIWYHLVYTYDGTTARIYKEGSLIGSQEKSWNTLNNNDVFRLGVGVGGELWFNGAIDDLKIYNYALSDTEVEALYDDEAPLSTNGIETNILKIYPNPAKDLVNIQTESEVKSVEIFNIQGQKVLMSNQAQINISDLSSGVYMIKITDENNNSLTQKIIKK